MKIEAGFFCQFMTRKSDLLRQIVAHINKQWHVRCHFSRIFPMARYFQFILL